ncbi:MAG: hypothetical protein ACRD4S_06255 [Candidatus Acidiferrales bacterium]
MQVVLLRVGIDAGSGGIQGPIFSDGSFEFIPIPDHFRRNGVSRWTYGNTRGRNGKAFVDYFPETRRKKASDQRVHFDPEFETFTYGDPTRPKASLRRLGEGSLLVFYAGLKGWNFNCPAALYIIGYFEVRRAGLATTFSPAELAKLFRKNFHVMHDGVFADQRKRLVLVKGNVNSRLLNKAVKISRLGTDRMGRPLQRLAPDMQRIFGDFGGKTSIQRSPPRWVAQDFTQGAADFVFSLR